MKYSALLAITVLACSAVSAQAQCAVQPTCPTGHGATTDAATDATSVADCCVECEAGTTWSAGGMDECDDNTISCSAGESFTASTTADTDTVCMACAAGKFKADPSHVGQPTCADHIIISCPAGEGLTSGTAVADGICNACTETQYSTGGAACADWTTVNAAACTTVNANHQWTTGTASTDSTCAVCDDGSELNAADTTACVACTGTEWSTGGVDCADWTTVNAAACTTVNANHQWTTGTASTDSTCAVCGEGTELNAADTTACVACTGTQWSTGGAACADWTNVDAAACGNGNFWTTGDASTDSTCVACTGTQWSTANAVCVDWTTVDAAACTTVNAAHQWTTGTASTDSTCAVCDDGSELNDADTTVCDACTGTEWSTGGVDCADWTTVDAAACTTVDAAHQWTTGDASTDSTCAVCDDGSELNAADTTACVACTGTEWSTGGVDCADWTTVDAAACTTVNAAHQWTTGTASTDSTCAVCDDGSELNAADTTACVACTGTQWSTGGVDCADWTTVDAAACTTVNAAHQWTTGTASTDSTCAVCDDGSELNDADTTACVACTGTLWSTGGVDCADWTTVDAAACTTVNANHQWTTGTASTDSTCVVCDDGSELNAADTTACVACTGTQWSTGGADCADWTTVDSASCGNGKFWTTGDASTDSTCVACTDTQWSTANAVCADWTTVDATACTTVNVAHQWTTGTASTDSTCAVCDDGSELNDADTTVCDSCTGTEWSTGGVDCADWTTVDAAACTTVDAAHQWTTGDASTDSTCAVCDDGSELNSADTTACVACTGTQWSTGGVDCADWTTVDAAACTTVNANHQWTTGTASTDSTCAVCDEGSELNAADTTACVACTGTQWSTGGAACADWTNVDAASCGNGKFWTTGDASTDSTCVACTDTQWSTANAACTDWTTVNAATCTTVNAAHQWTTGTASTDSTCAVCDDGSELNAADTTACVACTGTQWSTGGVDCADWTTVDAAACTTVNTNHQWTTGTASTDSTCAVCDDGSELNAADTTACVACTGTQWSTGGAACADWTNVDAAACGNGNFWTAGDASTDSTCVACTGTQWSTANAACADWTTVDAAACTTVNAAHQWTTGTASTDSTCAVCDDGSELNAADTTACVACTGTQWSTGGAACADWTNVDAAACGNGNFWTTGDASTDSTCVACTGTQWSTANAACTDWTTVDAATCTTVNAAHQWTTGTASTDSTCAVCDDGTELNAADTTACVACTGTEWSTGGVDCADWTTVDAAACTTVNAAHQWTTGTASTDSTCAVCDDGSELNAADTAACVACTGTLWSTGGVDCADWTTVDAAACTAVNTNHQWTTGTASTDSTCAVCDDGSELNAADTTACVACTGTQWSTGGLACADWTTVEAASCGNGKFWTTGDASTDSTCVACTGTQWSTANAACADWTTVDAAACTAVNAAHQWTTGTASTDSTCAVCDDGSELNAADTTVCDACTGTEWSTGGVDCADWTTVDAAACTTVNANHQWTTGTSSTDSTCAVCDDGSELNAADTTACVACTGTQWSTGGVDCVDWTTVDAASCGNGKFWTTGDASTDSTCVACTGTQWSTANAACTDWTTIDAAACTAVNAAHQWTTGTASTDSTCAVCDDGSELNDADTTACVACTGTQWSTGGVDCADWTTVDAAACTTVNAAHQWTTGTASTDSTCAVCDDGSTVNAGGDDCDVCTGTEWSTGGIACVDWTNVDAASCADGSFWTTGTASTDSTCVECGAGQFSAGNNDACTPWTDADAAACDDSALHRWTTGSTTADSQCAVCDDGSTVNAGGDGCDDCTGTQYSTGGAACADWTDPSAADCDDSALHRWTTGTASTDSTCAVCDDGSTVNAGGDDCDDCTGTQYSTGGAACADWTNVDAASCADGSFWTTGTTSTDSTCVECDAGQFSTGNDACTPCMVGSQTEDAGVGDGTFMEVGASACVTCTIGQYSADDHGGADCIDCVVGSQTEDVGVGDGTFMEVGASACVTCTIGQYSADDHGGADCIDCVIGSQTEDVDVGDGTFMEVGASACVTCTIGQYSVDDHGGADCIDCVVGSQTEDVGVGDGTFMEVGASACVTCTIGQYSADDHGGADCIDCVVGSQTEDVGVGDGTFMEVGASACVTCMIGQYSADDHGGADCIDCVVGKYIDVRGSDSLSDCIDCIAARTLM